MDIPHADHLAFGLSRRAALGATVAGIAAVGLGRAGAAPATPTAASEAILVGGEVAVPREITVADLQALPSETVAVTYLLPDGTEVAHRYTGPRLWDVLELAQPAIDPQLPESSLHLYVVLTARDGYVVVLSMGEIDPEFGGKPYLLAWAEDDEALAGEHAPAVLAAPGDRTEGRYIFGVVSIDVRRADGAAST